MRQLVFIICIGLFSNFLNAQFSLNDYKYVIVEKQFHFQNEEDEYNLNQMAKFMFRKHGFTAIVEGEDLPADLKANFCLALKSEIIAKGALRTKATIFLRDCENNIIYQSEEGVTKEKDFRRAYEISIRRAFDSFEGISYVYTPNEDIIKKGQGEEEKQIVEEAQKEIEDLKAEIKELKEEQKETEGKVISEDVPEIVEEAKPQELKKDVETIQPKSPEIKEKETDTIEIPKTDENMKSYVDERGVQVYFAKQTKNGFLVMDAGDVVMELLKTAKPNYFIVKGGDALVFPENGLWILSKASSDGYDAEPFDLKF